MLTSAPTTTLTFREIHSTRRLLELLRLRHLVYSHQGYWDHSIQTYDLDAYDAHSRFIGAYTEEGQLVGGARFIEADQSPHRRNVKNISGSPPPKREHSYTAQALWDFSPLVQEASLQGKRLVEFGRTVMHPEWQKSGLGRWLVVAIYALAKQYQVDLGLALVPPRLVNFYSRCGCHTIECDTPTHFTHTELVPVRIDLNQLGPVDYETRVAYDQLVHRGSYALTLEKELTAVA
jgi:predicted GNAT family N-acyltransferase